MSWLERLTPMRLPTHPGGAFATPLFTNDAGTLHCYSFAGKRVVSSQFGYSLTVGGSTAAPNCISYGGYMGFAGSSYNVWYDATYGWVASSLAIGSALVEYWAYTNPADTSQGGSYLGDAFYSGSFPALGGSASWTARGSLAGTTHGSYTGTAITVATSWSYWQLDSGSYGQFAPQGTATGYKYFGLPQWQDSSSTLYTRSLSQTNSRYSYGAISYNSTAGKYILGTYGSVSGWNESSSAPTAGASWTLSFAVKDGSTATGSDIVLSWVGYVLGSNAAYHYAITASIWRS
jgi:hypothetical protein